MSRNVSFTWIVYSDYPRNWTSYTIGQHQSARWLDSIDKIGRLCSQMDLWTTIFLRPPWSIILTQIRLDYQTVIGWRNYSFHWNFETISQLPWSHCSSILSRHFSYIFTLYPRWSPQLDSTLQYNVQQQKHHQQIKQTHHK